MSDLPVNIADVIFIVIVVLSGLLSFYKGIVQEVLRIASWIGAIFASLYAYHPTLPYVKQYVTMELAASTVTGSGLFVLFLVIFYIISNQIGSIVKSSSIGALNKSLGFVFGLGRGLVIVSVMYLTIGSIMNSNLPDAIQKAKSEPLVRATAGVLVILLPEKFNRNFTATLNNLSISAENAKNLRQTFDQLNMPTVDSIGDLIDGNIDK